MRSKILKYVCLEGLIPCLLLINFSASAQDAPSKTEMKTYSPYTQQQINEFNNQSLSPVEGPFGPVAPNAKEMNLSKKVPIDSKYYSQPQGEEEAEALETESAAPYQPISPVISF